MTKSSPDPQTSETSPSTTSVQQQHHQVIMKKKMIIFNVVLKQFIHQLKWLYHLHIVLVHHNKQIMNIHEHIINEFILLKNQYQQTKQIQHDLILNYHETILKVITSLQQSNNAHQEQIEQLRSEITNHIQDNETLKVNY